MKKTIISILAAVALASVASAQLYFVQGSTGVRAAFNFTIDDGLNKVTVDVLNNIAGVNNAKGSITGFGFNVPNSLNLNLVSFTASGGTGFVPGSWSLGPAFVLAPGFDQDLGVTGSPQPDTIQWGTTAQFVFSFNQNFVGNTGFLGLNGLSVRFQDVTNLSGQSGDSDKVFGNDEGGGGGFGAVPEPSTYGLIGALALLGLMVARQARRR